MKEFTVLINGAQHFSCFLHWQISNDINGKLDNFLRLFSVIWNFWLKVQQQQWGKWIIIKYNVNYNKESVSNG